MSVSIICYTFFALSCCCLVLNSHAEDRQEKPKEILRHQQNHRPPFIDRRLTLESRIQRYATDDETDSLNYGDSSTDSIHYPLKDDIAISAELDDDGLTMNDEQVKKYETETNIEKPATQIRHGRSRGHFARPLTKADEHNDSVETSAGSSSFTKTTRSKTRGTFGEDSLAADVQYLETNDTAYLDFDFEDSTERENLTVNINDSSIGLNAKTQRNSNNSRRFSQLTRPQTRLDTSSGRLITGGGTSDNRRADSFDKLRKVVVGSRIREQTRLQDGNIVRGISSSENVENSTWYRNSGIDESRNNGGDAVGGYGVMIHGILDDPSFDDTPDKTVRQDFVGYTGDNSESNDDHDRGADERYYSGRNSTMVRVGDYEEDYWDIGDGEFEAGTKRPDKQQSVQVDIVTRFLRIIENQHLLGENCTAGTDLNLGEGVVDQYAQERFRLEANLAVNRANMLTRLWKYAPDVMLSSEYLLHASILSMVEFDEDIFAAGNCYDKLQYRDRWLYCPFAHRLQDQDGVIVKDLAIEYKYLSNSSEWFYIARKNAERVIASNNQFSHGFHTYTHNESAHTSRVEDEILTVKYEDGRWSKPYYDCGGGNIWMLTYTVPFFGYTNDTYFFKGTSGIDIDLRRVDIDQCPLPMGSTQLNIFAASDKCKNRTTECVAIPGLGFRRGSYRCVCKRGYYYPDTKSIERYYNGTVIEEEFEKLMLGEDSQYSESGVFECLPCAEGCEYCEDGSPCVVSLNWLMRTAILILECCIIACLPAVILFTWKFGDVKVVRAASPVLLRVIVLGAFFIYCTTIVMYPRPNVVTCTIRVWLREIGFSLTYGALMLKTWRISVIFRVKSAKAVKITDMNLLKRLGIIVTIFAVFLGIRTLVAPPVVIVARTADDLKAYLCKTDWWDHSFTTLEVMFLVWGIRLCIVVRKAPSEFNESRFISMAIYNEFLLSVFLNVSIYAHGAVVWIRGKALVSLRLSTLTLPVLLLLIGIVKLPWHDAPGACNAKASVKFSLAKVYYRHHTYDAADYKLFLQSPANPDLLYIIFFCHTQLTVTLLLCLIFGSKAYVVFRGGGKEDAVGKLQGTTGKFIGKTCRTQGTSNQTNSISLQQGNFTEEADGVTEEFRRLYAQLELLKEKNMRLGNRHLVTKIQAMQEASSRADTQVSTIQAISSSLRLSVEPSSSTIEETEVSSKTDDKPVDIYHHHRRQDSTDSTTRNKGGKKKSLEYKNETNGNARRTKELKEQERRTNVDPVECSCAQNANTEDAQDNDDKELFARSSNDDNVNNEGMVESVEEVAPSQNSKSLSSPDNVEAADLVVSSTMRIKEVATAGNNSGCNNGSSAKERGKNKSGHARTHAIVINLDDKSRFSEEVTV